MASNIKEHQKHLAVVSADAVRRRLEGFRLKKLQLEPLPFICEPFIVRPPFTEYIKWMYPLDPVSLDDLKNWFGVPNEVAKKMLHETYVVCRDGKLWSGATQITPIALPLQRSWDFKKLDNEQRLAVQQMSKNLLYGFVTPESQKVASVEGVVNHMLDLVRRLKPQVFAAPDLIICPDDVVEFYGVPALYFNNILIYGNGKLKTNNTTTIHAVQIKRVP